MSLFWVSKMVAIFHNPFDPEVIKSALISLLWLSAALCAFVIVPIAFYLWGRWLDRRSLRALGDAEEIIRPDDRAI
jgi:antibiotic biosynthesis monooxygenase (ABM) superfamily enzyme